MTRNAELVNLLPKTRKGCNRAYPCTEPTLVLAMCLLDGTRYMMVVQVCEECACGQAGIQACIVVRRLHARMLHIKQVHAARNTHLGLSFARVTGTGTGFCIWSYLYTTHAAGGRPVTA